MVMMITSENGDSSSKGVSVAARPISISRRENLTIHISAAQGPIGTKLYVMDTSPALNTSTLMDLEQLIAPPIGYKK